MKWPGITVGILRYNYLSLKGLTYNDYMDGLSLVFCIKSITFTTIIFFISYIIGSFSNRFTLDEIHGREIIEGFVIFLGVFQVGATPILLFRLSFGYALAWFFCILASVGVFILIKGKTWINNKASSFINIQPDNFYRITLLFCVILILAQGLLSSSLNFSNADDSFYLGLAEKSIDNPSLYRNDPSTGDPRFPLMAQYRFGSWELLLGIFSKVSSLGVAELAHTVLPFSLIILAYLSYASFVKHFIPARYVPLFLIVLSLYHIWGGYSQYSQGSFLLTRIWQGKAILLHIILPYLFSILFSFFRKPSKISLGKLCICYFAAIALNPIAVYMVTIPVIGMTGIYILRKKLAVSHALLIISTLIPIVLFAIALKIGLNSSQVYNNPEEIVRFNPIQVFLVFWGKGIWILAGYFLSLPIFVKYTNKKVKSFYVYYPALLFLTIWNPILAPYFAKYLTSFATYWRVYWFLPVGMALGQVIVILAYEKRYVFLASFAVALVILGFTAGGSFIYANDNLFHPPNTLKIPTNHVESINFLKEEFGYPRMIMAPEDLAVSIPQLPNSIRLFWSRSDYLQDFLYREGNRREFNRRLHLEMIYQEGNKMTPEMIRSEVEAFGIDLIVVPEDNTILSEKLLSAKFVTISQSPGYLYFSPRVLTSVQ